MLSSQTIGLGAATKPHFAPGIDWNAVLAAQRARQAAAYTGGETTLYADKDKKPASEDNTLLYVGIGAGVLAVGGLAWYLSTHRKGRRRR